MKTITVHARIADFETAAAFIESWLRRCRLSKEIVSENSLVFETLFNDILLKGFPEETEIKIETGYSIGNPVIKIGFSGARYVPIGADDPEKNIEYKIIKAYEDKLNYDYRQSYNIIRISLCHGMMLDKSSALRYYKNILCICENRRNDPQKKSADSRLSNANEI